VARGYVSVRADGLNALVRELLALGLDVEDLKDAFAELAQRGARIAASHAPVGGPASRDPHPGQLKRDIRGNRARNKAVVTAGRAGVPYAGPINYGWPAHNIEPSGFLQKVDAELGPFAPLLLEHSISNLIRRRGLG
jgi:hypothetical protein